MDASSELAQLWELLGKGTHQAWPECVRPSNDGTIFRYGNEAYSYRMALDLVTANVQRFLEANGWAFNKRPGMPMQYVLCEYPEDGTLPIYEAVTLHDAVRYALESTTNPSTPTQPAKARTKQ